MARSRSITSNLSRLLAAVESPVYVLDERRAILYANSAVQVWLGIDPKQLVGTRCDYSSSADSPLPVAIAQSLCPPPEVFQGRTAVGAISCPTAGGSISRRQVQFVPLWDEFEACAGVIAVVAAAESTDDPAALKDDVQPTAQRLHEQLQAIRRRESGRYQLDRLIGSSPAICRAREQVLLATGSRSPTLIIGPPGSGREHTARTIHYAGQQPAPALLPLACPLLDPELLQTTLVAFVRRVEGGSAAGRLLLLDVDGLSRESQVELAGFMNLPDFRLSILATARRSLLQLSQEDAFRHDLAHALSTLVIDIPPLAQRPEDIPLLAQMVLEEHNASGGHQLAGFSGEALDRLCEYSWPENIDELHDIVREACAQAEGDHVTVNDLPVKLHVAAHAAAYPPRNEEKIDLDEFLADVERQLIERALQRSKGNKTKAASLLGITRARLHRRLAQLGMEE